MSKRINIKTETGITEIPIDAETIKGKSPLTSYFLSPNSRVDIFGLPINCYKVFTNGPDEVFEMWLPPADNTKAGVMTRDDKIFLDSVQGKLNAKQDTLVSGTNIKTINGTSLLDGGDIDIQNSVVDRLRFFGLEHTDGSGYATSGYVYFTNNFNTADKLLICYGTTGSIGGVDSNSTITFSQSFVGKPVIIVQMVGINNVAPITSNIYRNAQFVRGFINEPIPNSYLGKTTGFNLDCGNNDPHYYSYIAIGKPRF